MITSSFRGCSAGLWQPPFFIASNYTTFYDNGLSPFIISSIRKTTFAVSASLCASSVNRHKTPDFRSFQLTIFFSLYSTIGEIVYNDLFGTEHSVMIM